MKRVALADALKKTKKNVKKVFEPPNVNKNDLRDLYNVIGSFDLKNLVQLSDLIDKNQIQKDPNEDAWHSTEQVLYELYSYSSRHQASDYKDVVTELIVQLKAPQLRSFIYAMSEITTGRLTIPDVLAENLATWQSMGLGGTYGTLNSLPLIGSGSAAYLNGGPSLNTINGGTPSIARLKGATLTGGGQGPTLPPLESSDLRMITIEKKPTEEWGLIVTTEEQDSVLGPLREVIIKRIMVGSKIEQQGLLHVGDVIREVNGFPVDSPKVLQEKMREASGSVTLKVIPSYKERNLVANLFMRAHFSYNPLKDTLLPCKESGLHFKNGDVLQILDQTDPHWWQARHHGTKTRASLIPSQTLQERRCAHEQSAPDPDKLSYGVLGMKIGGRTVKKKKVTIEFSARHADDYESKDLIVYEEVALISGFQRPVIILLGAQGVGRRTIRNMLIEGNPARYAPAIPYTSRPKLIDETPGEEFFFDTNALMEQEYRRNAYIEYGEHEGYMYGLKYETVRNVIKEGRTCLVDCHPKSVQALRTAEFMPFVVFLAAPAFTCMKAMYEYGRSQHLTEKFKSDEALHDILEESKDLERTYNHLFDLVLINDNLAATYEILCKALDDLLAEPQWVPAKWLY
ncbi:MAGUK p55 subfamily member 6 [Cichlidogyrus casuarinus]|uniref:MAGUK p55 subfamily member 6 n=1 Tax=Cichlidogyrus casuarinus TaxID=1844966 RepID=A0ABD2Q206_9PLAT